jgi:RHS repeat-associated protein
MQDGERMKFTGHERDLCCDGMLRYTDNMHARQYAPLMGRFLSVDPSRLSVVARQPQTWNRYSYVYSRALVAVDPDGAIPYLVARPLSLPFPSPHTAQHLFIVTHARYPGDPRARVFSFGPTRTGMLGLLTSTNAARKAKDTRSNDRAAWLSLANPNARASYRAIPASDDAVASTALNVRAVVPYRDGGPNSNSAAVAVANRAAGTDIPLPGQLDTWYQDDHGAIGAGHADRVQFASSTVSLGLIFGLGDPFSFQGALVDGVWVSFR